MPQVYAWDGICDTLLPSFYLERERSERSEGSIECRESLGMFWASLVVSFTNHSEAEEAGPNRVHDARNQRNKNM